MSFISAGNTTTTTLLINGDTTGNLVFNTGGANTTALTISNTQAATFANNVTITGALTATGGVIQGANAAPAFYAYLSASQTGVSSAAHTKVQLNTELFDTNNNFDSTTNYRFTPTVAGYYQISWGVNMSGTGLTYSIGEIYKNGTTYQYGSFNSVSAIEALSTGASLVYMNGSTDYLELYAISTASSGTVTFTGANSFRTFMSGVFVRSA